MCTSLTLTADDHTTVLARTMDFPNVDPWAPTRLPAGTNWQPFFGNSQTTQFDIIGAARHLNHHHLFGDGLNAAGLSCAELYFPNRTHYYDDAQPNMINLTPQDFILWVLSNYETIADVERDLPNVALVSHIWYAENKIYPFHWILADATGRTAVLEPTELGLHFQSDPVHVLTNTPTLPDHLVRLSHYLGANDLTNAATIWLRNQKSLPDGPIPTDRFIRTAINCLGRPIPKTGEMAITQALETLKQVVIPRKMVRPGVTNHNFTHYISVLDVTHLTYTHYPIDTEDLAQYFV